MKITVRLWLLFIVAALLPMALFGYFNLKQSDEVLHTEALGRMSDLADKKAVQVRSYLEERVQNVRLLAHGPRVQSGMEALALEYAAGRLTGERYALEDAKTRRYFERYIEESNLFYDVFLISPQGDIVYSQKHESDFATNLLDGPWRESGLAQAFRTTRMTFEPAISGYQIYLPSRAPAVFVTAPVIVEGKFRGVLAAQLDNGLLYRVATDATGLGKSGEVTFAQYDGDGVRYTTPLKYRDDAAMKYRVSMAELKSLPTAKALGGHSGEGVVPDYRGVAVAAAWRYLPGLNWGMVVKVDEAEVMEPSVQQRWLLLGALAGCLLLSGWAAYYFGRRISRPVRALAQVAEEVAQGRLDSRADEKVPGELGRFAQVFNRMTGNLQELYRTLELRIESRTHELNEANERLQEEIDERVQTELTLHRNNAELALYKRFMDSASNAMGMAQLDGVLIYGNQALGDLIGVEAGRLGEHRVEEFLRGEALEEWRDRIQPTVVKDGGWAGEIRLIDALGQSHDTESEVFMVKDADGLPYALAAVITDISARKQVETLSLRHKTVLDTAQDGYWLADTEGRLVEANAAYAGMSGYTVDELLGMHIAQLEANEDADAIRARIEKLLAEGHDRFETRHRRKDGHLIDVEVSVTFMRQAGQFFVFCRDITQRKQDQRQLRRQHDLLGEAQRLGRLGSWELDLVSGELFWSDEIFRIFELDPERFRPSYENFLNAIHPDDRESVNQAYSRSLEDRQPYDVVHRLRMADGRVKWVREHCSSDFDPTGKPLRSVGAVQDITQQKLAEDELRIAAATFETHEAIMITDADARILRVNQAFEETTGYTVDEVRGRNPRMLSSGRQDQMFYAEMWRHLKEEGAWTGEMWDRRKDGELYPKWLTITAVRNDAGETSEYVAIFSDITERKQAEEEIRNLAFYDALTRLPNRRLLLDRLQLALTVSARSQSYGAILFLDMDRFKVLNDTLGHDYGDLMLVEVAERIRHCVREVDTVARLGGDEFVVLLESVSDEADDASRRVALVGEKIREALAQPYRLKESVHHSSPSIGVSLFRGNLEPVEVLLKQADLAMYQAKEAGRNAVRFFDPAMQQAVEMRACLEADLRNAAGRGELYLYYQMQVDNAFRPRGAEALLRWQHPQRGLVSPAQFIPIAEESSQILEIGNWVLDSACAQLARWRNYRITRDLSIAVNVSSAQFRQHDFVERIADRLRGHGIEPSRLKLELTESIVLADVADVIAKMQALRELGVALSLDDFGTGYSSLSYLKQLPLNQIKIDQSFVRGIGSDRSDELMVRTIIDLAQNFGLEVVAEGVETEAQRQFLKQHGCPVYQGYLFSRPVPIAELEQSLGGV